MSSTTSVMTESIMTESMTELYSEYLSEEVAISPSLYTTLLSAKRFSCKLFRIIFNVLSDFIVNSLTITDSEVINESKTISRNYNCAHNTSNKTSRFSGRDVTDFESIFSNPFLTSSGLASPRGPVGPRGPAMAVPLDISWENTTAGGFPLGTKMY